MSKLSEPICYHCKKPILNNQGTFWAKGTGGLFARGVYPETIRCAHWGRCAKIVGRQCDEEGLDNQGLGYYWGLLPFYPSLDDLQSNPESDKDKFIYIFKSDSYYKIGITKDIEQRIRNLQTGNPIEIAFVCASFIENASKFEAKLHNFYQEYNKHREWFELSCKQLEELIEILGNKDFVEKVPPFDNIVYYPVGTRVLWREQKGIVHSLDIKPYKYEVGYNIILDTQIDKNEPDILNSGYDELVLEETGEPQTEGYEVEPIKINSEKLQVISFKDFLENNQN